MLTIAVAVGVSQPTAAYGQTAENTVISNTATVSYTDANSNTYSSVNGSVNVTVGFVAGVDVVTAQATASPVVNSTGNTMDFYVINVGNGTDSMSVGETNSAPAVLTVTKFTFNSTDYANIGLLNTALAAVALAATDTATITVEYSIADDTGGDPSTYTLTGTSRRDSGVSDNDNTVVTPALTGNVVTAPDVAQTLTLLPSGGSTPTYSFTFTVDNQQTGTDVFDLLATTSGSAISIVSVKGLAGDSSSATLGPAAGPTNFSVVYTVAGAAGAVDTLFLEARSRANPSTTDSGYADMTVIAASMTITKQAYRDNQTTLLGGGDLVLPGEYIQYKVTVTNNGTAPASSVHVDDNLPATLTYQSATGDLAGWSFSNSGNDLDADLSGTLGTSASRFFWIRVLVN